MKISILSSILLAITYSTEILSYPIVENDGIVLDSRSPTQYAPRGATCPSSPLVRQSSSGLNPLETAYAKARLPIAQTALKNWLNSLQSSFDTSNCNSLPSLGYVSSGGGFRALLVSAGVHQAFDSREQGVSSKLKGLYQSMLYESGLSGGSWLLSSIMGNNWPTITQLQQNLWDKTFPAGPLDPSQSGVLFSDADIVAAIGSKQLAGFDTTLIDVYGRFLSYSLLEQPEGGVAQTLSSITTQPNYLNHQYPFPIITTIQAAALQECTDLEIGGTQFEFTPIEYGSWDKEIAGFVPTKYIGSIIGSDGKQSCITGYDNLGYIFGSSSNIFTELCSDVPSAGLAALQGLQNFTESILGQIHRPTAADIYGIYPDTFAKQAKPASSYPPKFGALSKPSDLYMMDGGFSGQVDPIWPFLYDRQVNVLFVSDNDAETSQNWPNGSSIYQTYLEAQNRGLTRMPTIPDPSVFVAKGYNKRSTFFGCNQGSDVMSIVWMPNNEYSFASNTSTFQIMYSTTEIQEMLSNGQLVGTNDNASGYEVCVACLIMKKTSTTLPNACTQCFTEYCAS